MTTAIKAEEGEFTLHTKTFYPEKPKRESLKLAIMSAHRKLTK
jgi:uncharacterized protein YbaA (DUF1428 family)